MTDCIRFSNFLGREISLEKARGDISQRRSCERMVFPLAKEQHPLLKSLPVASASPDPPALEWSDLALGFPIAALEVDLVENTDEIFR